MTEQPIIKSKLSVSAGLFFLFGGVFFGVFCVWILSGAFVNGYPQIGPIIMGVIFGGFALPCFWYLYFKGGFFQYLKTDSLYILT